MRTHLRQTPRGGAYTKFVLLCAFFTAAAAYAILRGNLFNRGYDHAKRSPGGIHEITDLKSALDTFEVDNHRYPTTTEGLNALITCPPGLEKTWHKTLKKIPADPSGSPLIYTATETSYTLTSPGPDKTPNTADDVEAPN